MIGGNTEAIVQIKLTDKNEIGETEETWLNHDSLVGWLDLSNGDSSSTYNAKIQESTHLFICDYKSLSFTSENARFLIDGHVYEVKLIDDPMGMHQHLEIYLKYIGGGLGVR